MPPRNINIGIFIPVYHREKFVQDSLNSIGSTLILNEKYILRTSIWIGVNGASEDLSSYLLDFCKKDQRAGSRNVLFHPKNIGKPSSVNTLVNIADGQAPLDYVVSYDSDMVVTDPGWLLKLVEIYEEFPVAWGNARIGALCPAQAVGNCHVLDKDPFTYKFGNYTLVGRAGNQGVAGGVLFTSMHVWKAVGGYYAHRIYASDDGHFMLSCSKLGLMCLVVQEVSLIHPVEIDPQYASWKVRACHDQLFPHELNGFWK